MVDSLTLYNTQNHKVKLIETDGTEHIGVVDFYESEYDSGYDMATIGLNNNGILFKADEIKSIEIID